jgi:hypothetical protein
MIRRRAKAGGQAASQMVLHYIMVRDVKAVETLLDSGAAQQRLKLKYDKTTTSVFDLYCAQAQAQSAGTGAPIVADVQAVASWFSEFEIWFNTIKGSKIPRVPLNSATKVASFIAAATQTWGSVNDVSESQWENIQLFLMKGPADIQLHLGMEFSATRGKWPGQKKQIDQTFAICRKITQT